MRERLTEFAEEEQSLLGDGTPLPHGRGSVGDVAEIPQLTEHLFRHEAGKLVSIITGIFGADRLQLAEDVVQEALARAF